MFKVTMSTMSWFPPDLIASPVAAVGWRAAGGFLVELVLTVAVCWGVCNARAAGGCGRTGGGLGFNLQPLVTQSLSKVVVNGDADGELGAGLLVVQPQAPLEVLLHHVVVVAFGNHWKTRAAIDINYMPEWVRESQWVWMSDLVDALGGPQICRMGSSVMRHRWSLKAAPANPDRRLNQIFLPQHDLRTRQDDVPYFKFSTTGRGLLWIGRMVLWIYFGLTFNSL